MEIEEKNGVTHYSNFEIDKALTNLKRGISLETFFKHEAKRFEYGEDDYFEMLKKEIEYEYQNYDYLHDSWDYIQYTLGISIEEVEKIIIDLQKSFEKPPTPQLQPPIFTGLFKHEYVVRIDKFYNRLIAEGYIDKDHIWRESKENEPAKVYFWLLDNGVLKHNTRTPALICFCREFGIIAYKDTEPRPTAEIRAVTVKNLLNTKLTTDEKKRFENVFSSFLIK